MKSYSDTLKDPRWQRRRLEVLQRDNWACTLCGDTKSTLHVHHRYYERGMQPWDYPGESLRTLCESCHERVTTARADAVSALNALDERLLVAAVIYLRAIGDEIGNGRSIPEVVWKRSTSGHWPGFYAEFEEKS